MPTEMIQRVSLYIWFESKGDTYFFYHVRVRQMVLGLTWGVLTCKGLDSICMCKHMYKCCVGMG